MVAYVINFLFAVGGVSGAGEWNRNQCYWGQNQVSEARWVCPACLHCEFLLLTPAELMLMPFFLIFHSSLFTFSLLPSPSLSSTLLPTLPFPLLYLSPPPPFVLLLFRLPSLSPFTPLSLHSSPLHSSLSSLLPYWCIAWNHWWTKRSYDQPWQCKFQFVSSLWKRNHFNRFTSHMYDCACVAVCFRSPLMQELLTELMSSWGMEKIMQLATFHWVILLLRYMSYMYMSMPQHSHDVDLAVTLISCLLHS